jgi:hypothetical protein
VQRLHSAGLSLSRLSLRTGTFDMVFGAPSSVDLLCETPSDSDSLRRAIAASAVAQADMPCVEPGKQVIVILTHATMKI